MLESVYIIALTIVGALALGDQLRSGLKEARELEQQILEQVRHLARFDAAE